MTGGPHDKHRHHRTSKFVQQKTETPPPQTPVNEAALRSLGFNDTTIRLLKNVDGRIERLVEETKKSLLSMGQNIEFEVTQGFRTAREQYQKYLRHTSPCDGYRNKSNHQSGAAIDYSVYVNGAYVDNGADPRYRKVAEVFKSVAHKMGYDMTWGGDYKNRSPDWDHIEVKKYTPVYAKNEKGGDPSRAIMARTNTPPAPRKHLVETPAIVEAFLQPLQLPGFLGLKGPK